MFKFGKSNYKNIIILILMVLVIIFIWSSNKNKTDNNLLIDKLKTENKRLIKDNDSLLVVNNEIDKKINEIGILIRNVNNNLKNIEYGIDEINNERYNNKNAFDNLDASGVSSELSKYIKKRRSQTDNK